MQSCANFHFGAKIKKVRMGNGAVNTDIFKFLVIMHYQPVHSHSGSKNFSLIQLGNADANMVQRIGLVSQQSGLFCRKWLACSGISTPDG